MELPQNPTDRQRLDYLRYHLSKKPNSLALRNALVALEKHLGLEPTVMGIDPKKFIEALTERLNNDDVNYTVKVFVPKLTMRQWLRLLARKIRMYFRHKKTTSFKWW